MRRNVHDGGGGASSLSNAGQGRFMAFPPMVQRESMAVPMAQDVRLYVERLGGRLPLMARARLMGGSRRMGFGICPGFL